MRLGLVREGFAETPAQIYSHLSYSDQPSMHPTRELMHNDEAVQKRDKQDRSDMYGSLATEAQ